MPKNLTRDISRDTIKTDLLRMTGIPLINGNSIKFQYPVTSALGMRTVFNASYADRTQNTANEALSEC
jgi:hypothetical protein